MEILGSLTIKTGPTATANDSSLAFGRITFASTNASLDIQTPFTFSSAQGITSGGNSGLLSIDYGGSMTVTGAATRLDVSVNVGDACATSGTLTFVDLASNVAMKTGREITVDHTGTFYLSQAANSSTSGGLTSDGITDHGLIERTGTDTAAVIITAPITVDGKVVLDDATSFQATSISISPYGDVDLGRGGHLFAPSGITLTDATSQFRVLGSNAADTTSFIHGSVTVDDGSFLVGVNEGNGKFTTVNFESDLSLWGGSLSVSILGGAGNTKSDTLNCDGTFIVSRAAALSVNVQNGQQPVLGTVYTLVNASVTDGRWFGSVSTTGAAATWKQTLGPTSFTITVVAKVGALNLGTSADPSTLGQAVTFTATALASDGITPTGTVNFYDKATLLGTPRWTPMGSQPGRPPGSGWETAPSRRTTTAIIRLRRPWRP